MTTDNTAGSAAPAGPSDEGRADAWLLKVHAHLQEALRIPTMPWPDPGAHGHEATARAIHASYCALRFKVIDAIAELTATRVAITGLLADRATRGAAGAEDMVMVPRELLAEIEGEFWPLNDLAPHIRKMQDRIRDLQAQLAAIASPSSSGSAPTWQQKVMERMAFERGVQGMRDRAILVIEARHESGHDCSPTVLVKAIREADDPTDPCAAHGITLSASNQEKT